MLVETLVAKLAVEALHEAILLRLAWRDVVPLDTVLLGPLEHGVRGQLRAVVGDDHRRLATLGHDRIQRPYHALARQRCVNLGAKPSRVSWSSTLNTRKRR